MRQIITFNDNRGVANDGHTLPKFSLEIRADGLSGRVCVDQADTGSQESGCTSFTIDITVPENCALLSEDDREYVADWFDHIETVASDAPMEYSEKHFSVCDTLEDIAADHNAFRILANAMYSMSGIKMTKSMPAEMGHKTPLELASALGSADSPTPKAKIPENAMQIINAELSKIAKK